MVLPAGFAPAVFRLSIECFNWLSYGREMVLCLRRFCICKPLGPRRGLLVTGRRFRTRASRTPFELTQSGMSGRYCPCISRIWSSAPYLSSHGHINWSVRSDSHRQQPLWKRGTRATDAKIGRIITQGGFSLTQEVTLSITARRSFPRELVGRVSLFRDGFDHYSNAPFGAK